MRIFNRQVAMFPESLGNGDVVVLRDAEIRLKGKELAMPSCHPGVARGGGVV